MYYLCIYFIFIYFCVCVCYDISSYSVTVDHWSLIMSPEMLVFFTLEFTGNMHERACSNVLCWQIAAKLVTSHKWWCVFKRQSDTGRKREGERWIIAWIIMAFPWMFWPADSRLHSSLNLYFFINWLDFTQPISQKPSKSPMENDGVHTTKIYLKLMDLGCENR